MIKLENVSKKYEKNTVLRDFSLAIESGETVALSGPSGIGKTTVLRMLAGLLRPDHGKVLLPRGTRISYLFQEPRLLPWKSVIDNVLCVYPDGTHEEAMKLLGKLGIAESTNLFPHELSGGMKQRAAIARTLFYPADLYLLDEPTSALDEENAATAISLIREVTKGKAVVLVTHDPNIAKQMQARVVPLSLKE